MEEADTKEKAVAIQADLREEMSELSNNFAVKIQENDLGNATKLMIKMKYLASIDNSLKDKLQRFMSKG